MCDREMIPSRAPLTITGSWFIFIAAHDLQSLDDWSIDPDSSKLIQGSHDYIMGLIRPLCVRNLPDIMRSDEACNFSVFRQNEAPPAASQKVLIGETLNAQRRLHWDISS